MDPAEGVETELDAATWRRKRGAQTTMPISEMTAPAPTAIRQPNCSPMGRAIPEARAANPLSTAT